MVKNAYIDLLFLNAFLVENLAKRKKGIVIVVYLMHIKWLYFVRKHHIIKNSIINLLSTSSNQYKSRISKNITNICCDFFSNYSILSKKPY